MSESKSKKPFLIILIFLMSQIVLVISLFTDELVENCARSELSMMVDVYGESKSADYLNKANEITYKLIIDSGAVNSIRTALLPKEHINGEGVDKRGRVNEFFNAVDKAITNLTHVFSFTVLRIVSFATWIPLSILLLVGAFTSGYLMREIKKEGFEYSSPLRHGVAKNVIYTLPLTLYILLILPIAINPYCYPLIISIVAMFVSWYVSNTIKRV